MIKDLIIYTPLYVTFFWAIVLITSHRNKNRAKYFLGVFMFTAFLIYLAHTMFFKQQFKIYYIFDSIYVFASLAVYPLYFWYIKLLTIESKLNFKNLWMFIPTFVLGFFSLVTYLLMLPVERQTYILHYLLDQNTSEKLTFLVKLQNWIFHITRVIFAIQVVLVLTYGSKLVLRYNKRVANFYSNLEDKTIIWVNLLLFSFVLTSIMSIVFNVIGKAVFFNHGLLLLIPSMLFSVLLFIIGLQGYMQDHTVVDFEYDDNQDKKIIHKNFNTVNLNEKLLDLFSKEEIYKNPDLKITYIAEMLHTNRTYVSKHINTEFSCTFNDFVNRYRIEEAKRLLTDEVIRNYSLNYISEKSGFGSMGSFMRVFRDVEGITPGQFRERNTLKK